LDLSSMRDKPALKWLSEGILNGTCDERKMKSRMCPLDVPMEQGVT
jgi:hypothetical protein